MMESEDIRYEMRIKRKFYLSSFIVLFFVEAFIALFVRDKWIRPYLGDVLVVVVVYCLVRTIIPAGCRYLPAFVFAFACMVEAAQYFQIVKLLGLGGSKTASVIMGTTFDWKDILCYLVGCFLLILYEHWEKRSQKR